MSALMEEGTQRLSLVGHSVQDEQQAEDLDRLTYQSPSAQRSTFWRGLFRKRSSAGGSGGDDPDNLEDSALLNTSAADLEYHSRRGDDEELDDYRDDGGDPSHRRRLLVGGSAINESSDEEDGDDDDESEDDENEQDDKDNPMGHSLLSMGDDDDNDQNGVDLLNMHESDLDMHHNHKPIPSEDNEDGESSGESDDDEEEGSDEEEDDEPPQQQAPSASKTSQPFRNFLRRAPSSNSNSYSDKPHNDDDGSMADYFNTRKNIHGRIQGFGSEPSPSPNSDSQDRFGGARNLRQRLRDLTSQYRMKKMSIGTEDMLNRPTWVERFDNVVDRVLPPDPELEGYIDAFKVRGQAIVPVPDEQPQRQEPRLSHSKSRREPPVINIRGPSSVVVGSLSHRRQKLGDIDDASYILFLECELQNKELELHSWKRRAHELETQVKRLNGEEVDDDSSRTSNSDGEEEVEGESEIEWQTGVAEEGVLIDVEDSSPKKQVEEPKEAATFVLTHAPDGPNGDDEVQIIRRPTQESAEEEVKKGYDDDSFPVLSSHRDPGPDGNDELQMVKSPEQGAKKREMNQVDSDDAFPVLSSLHDSGTIWMDVAPAAISPIKPLAAFKDQDDNATDDSEEEEEDSDAEDGEDENEESVEGQAELPQEGTLIELDDGPPKEDAKTKVTADVSDDESVNAKEGMLLDLDGASGPPSPLNVTLDDTPVVNGTGDLITIES